MLYKMALKNYVPMLDRGGGGVWFSISDSEPNSSVTFAETAYVYVSKGSLSIGEIKLPGRRARRGDLIFDKCPRACIYLYMNAK